MQNSQWEFIGDQLLTKSPIELKDNSNESRERERAVVSARPGPSWTSC